MEEAHYLYQYKGKIRRVIDGDTVVVDVDLGFRTVQTMVFRLYGVNTPEVVGEERAKGLEAKEFVKTTLPEGKDIYIHTYKDRKGKYGRYLADVFFDNDNNGQENLSETLIEKGLGERI